MQDYCCWITFNFCDKIKVMTKLMEQAIERLKAIPESQQDQLAQFLLAELEEDERWAASTNSHVDALERLTQQILNDDACGNCPKLDVEQL